jgi:O-antigen/teichoic acid export membrane protein
MLVPSALGLLGTLGLPLAVTFEVATDPIRGRLVVRALRRWIVLQAVALTAIQTLVLAFVLDPGDRPELLAASPIMAALVVQQYGLAILQGLHRFRAFNCARIAPATLYALGLGALAIAGHASLLAIVLMWTAVNVAVAVPLLLVLVGYASSGGVDVDRLRGLVGFGLRAGLGTYPPSDVFRVDQVVVALMLPRSDLGLYVVALAFTNLPRFISQSLGMVALPAAAAAHRLGHGRDLTRLYLGLLLATAGTVVVALEFSVGRLVPLLFGNEFGAAVPTTRILLLAALALATRRVLSDLAQGAGSPGIGALAEGGYMLVALPALPLAAAAAGIEGIAVAVALGSVASLLVLLVAVHRRSRISSALEPAAQPREATALR